MVGDDAGGGVVPGEGERAVGGCKREVGRGGGGDDGLERFVGEVVGVGAGAHHGGEAHALDVAQAVGVGQGDGAGGAAVVGAGAGARGEAGLLDLVVAGGHAVVGGDGGGVVGAVDGEGERGVAEVAIGILERVAEGVGEGLGAAQGEHGGVAGGGGGAGVGGAVEGVGVVAVGRKRQAPVGAIDGGGHAGGELGAAGAGGHAGDGGGVGTLGVGHTVGGVGVIAAEQVHGGDDVAGGGGGDALGDGVGVGDGGGHVVDDRHRQRHWAHIVCPVVRHLDTERFRLGSSRLIDVGDGGFQGVLEACGAAAVARDGEPTGGGVRHGQRAARGGSRQLCDCECRCTSEGRGDADAIKIRGAVRVSQLNGAGDRDRARCGARALSQSRFVDGSGCAGGKGTTGLNLDGGWLVGADLVQEVVGVVVVAGGYRDRFQVDAWCRGRRAARVERGCTGRRVSGLK